MLPTPHICEAVIAPHPFGLPQARLSATIPALKCTMRRGRMHSEPPLLLSGKLAFLRRKKSEPASDVLELTGSKSNGSREALVKRMIRLRGISGEVKGQVWESATVAPRRPAGLAGDRARRQLRQPPPRRGPPRRRRLVRPRPGQHQRHLRQRRPPRPRRTAAAAARHRSVRQGRRGRRDRTRRPPRRTAVRTSTSSRPHAVDATRKASGGRLRPQRDAARRRPAGRPAARRPPPRQHRERRELLDTDPERRRQRARRPARRHRAGRRRRAEPQLRAARPGRRPRRDRRPLPLHQEAHPPLLRRGESILYSTSTTTPN